MTDTGSARATLDPPGFGIAPYISAKLVRVLDAFPDIDAVWVYGSRARGSHRMESDIDLAVDAPSLDDAQFVALKSRIENLELIYRLDIVHLQRIGSELLKQHIARDRKLFWEPRRHKAAMESAGATQLKAFQTTALVQLERYLGELKKHQSQAQAATQVLRVMEGMEDLMHEASDFPKKTWNALKSTGHLPRTFAGQPHSSRFDGANRAIPNVCLKIPTGGGKTLLAAASVGRIFSGYLGRHTGLVLWVVPNEAIYQQTLKTLKNRDHPYHQMLNVAGAGRVKILEKNSPLSRMDTDSHLCVMLLMLASAARQSKETLRFFRDRGNVLGYTPREDDIEAHWKLLGEVPNLDAYTSWGTSQAEARANKGSIVKSSLGNVMRLLRPMVVIDEGHHAYTETALKTIDGFNPCFMLELSATPRVSSDKGSGSNILVDVRGTDLDEAEMIKLPIHVDMRGWPDWQSCLASSMQKLDDLQRVATELQTETNRYIRPMLLVQVERTGKDLRDSGFIHAEDAKAYLLQLGLSEAQIAIKTSDRNDLNAPENIDLLSPQCEVRAIITKQALQEGWDCPFAYVLCALAAGKEVRAMTQLMGRILRQPHVTKTGKAALDACYALCHDAKTGEVIKAIKLSLETEGMGDLGLEVTGPAGDILTRTEVFKRRPQFKRLQIFLPRVTWVEQDDKGRKRRRELAYESDVLARVAWSEVRVESLAQGWLPGAQGQIGQQMQVDLDVLDNRQTVSSQLSRASDTRLERSRIARGLLDIAPNAWWAWDWVSAVVQRLMAQGFSEAVIADSDASLLERLRVDVEAERDRLALAAFAACVAGGAVEFRLRADTTDYEIPEEFSLALSGKPRLLMRDDGRAVEKSLFEPALEALADNGLERDVACYIDGQAAVRWWHRNVARSQYGLQGWKRHKVYPDFVFAQVTTDGTAQLVVLETKGLHLAGSGDTIYKQQLLARLNRAFADQSHERVGELELVGEGASVICDLVFDQAWRSELDTRYFGSTTPCALAAP